MSSNPWNSAITEYCLSSVRALSLCGYENHLTVLSGSPAAQRARDLELNYTTVSNFNFYSLYLFLKEFRRLSPDVVVVYGGKENVLSKFFPNSTPVFRFRGYEITELNGFARLKYKLTHAHTEAVILPSKRLLSRHDQLTSGIRGECVMLGVDETKYFYTADEGVASDPYELLIFGRFDPIKGHREFMSLFREVLFILSNENISIQLHCIGNSENVSEEQLKQCAEELGISKYIHVHGKRVKDGPLRMRRAIAGLVPSLGSEEICRVSQEFLMCGVPVIVSQAGSLSETIKASADGIVFNMESSSSPKQIADFIVQASKWSALEREERSTRSLSIMSLGSMGHRLEKVLFDN